MTRRSKLEIYLEVLNVIKSGASKPTGIMFQAKISYSVLQYALRSLVHQGLISKTIAAGYGMRANKETRVYEITAKGERILDYFKNAEGLIQVDDQSIGLYAVADS
ncbi:MAG: winged helix-turn-helix domain-containing protein [Candidatus Bathyarchaeota archaeon]|nr:winged helix-turn-helix domain-containing protein [Candidatus Bathyarchaeota archaeon]